MPVRRRECAEEVEEEDGVCRKYATDSSNPIEEANTPPPLPFQLQPRHPHKHAHLLIAIAYDHEMTSPNHEGSYEDVCSLCVALLQGMMILASLFAYAVLLVLSCCSIEECVLYRTSVEAEGLIESHRGP